MKEISALRPQGNLSSVIRLFVLDYFRSSAVAATALADAKQHATEGS
jgi:predicted DNA-binding ribbon-helix-helix protein